MLVEALWTGALVAYARCFSGRAKVLTDDHLAELELDGDVAGFHRALLKLRDHYASRHVNPRETYTIGVAQKNNGTAAGVAVIGAPQPGVDDTTVRQLGRIAYGLSGLVDARMQAAQQRVHLVAQGLDARRLAALPLVDVHVPGDRLTGPDQQVLQLVARRATGRRGVLRGVQVGDLALQPVGPGVVEVGHGRDDGREVPPVVGGHRVGRTGEVEAEPPWFRLHVGAVEEGGDVGRHPHARGDGPPSSTGGLVAAQQLEEPAHPAIWRPVGHHHGPAGAADPQQLAGRRGLVGREDRDDARQDGIELAVGERQCLGVCHLPAQRQAALAGAPLFRRTAARP